MADFPSGTLVGVEGGGVGGLEFAQADAATQSRTMTRNLLFMENLVGRHDSEFSGR
jgi:hypothetical protein